MTGVEDCERKVIGCCPLMALDQSSTAEDPRDH